MTVTFFGHRRIEPTLQPLAYSVLCDLIENKGADIFYVGHNGEFDVMIKNTLIKIKEKYPHIRCTVVLSYLNEKGLDEIETLYPENLEEVPLRFAILSRNKWMIEESDLVVSYVRFTASNSSKFVDIARNKQKQIINLADFL